MAGKFKSSYYFRAMVAHTLCCLAFSCAQRIDPKTADLEVRKLLQDAPGFEWSPGPASRMAYQNDSELPLPPKDDEDSRKVTERIQKDGAFADGNASAHFEDKDWVTSLSSEEGEVLRLDLNKSMELALLHSRDFQKQKEALYLSALDVTYERFRLGPIPFTKFRGEADWKGKDNPSDFEVRSSAGLQGLANSGANWTASLANRLSMDLSSGDITLGGSLANLSITQPLLRGASRRIFLESLTQSERSLLANARKLEQFRQGFFLDVAIGTNPSGRVGTGTNISLVPPPSTAVSGFLGLIQEIQSIRNQEANVAKLNDSLSQLQAAFEAGRIGNRLQVDQARQALYNGQSRLLAAKSSFENRMDGFKIFLGLPPDLGVSVLDVYIEHFRFTDPKVVALQEQTNLILSQVRDPQNSQSLESLSTLHNQANLILPKARECFRQLEEDINAFKQVIPARKKGYKNLRKRSDLLELGMSLDAFRDQDIDKLWSDLNATIQSLSISLRGFEDKMGEWKQNSSQQTLKNARSKLAFIVNEFSGTLLELSLTQASARLESIVLEKEEISPAQDSQAASNHRMDAKNNRAALVDVWRAADLARDDLRTDLDLVLSGDLGSDSMKAGQFKSDESSWSVGLELDTPLAKIRERNRYKEALIRYQQSRRSYLAFEDTLLRAFREHLRLSNLYELNFELNRAAVRGAIAQVDLARLRLEEPPKPGRSAQFGATTARDLVNALNDLLDASNSFLDVWIGYEAMRMRYAYDLGQMKLNKSGIWEDL
jgi:hypothetical protein